MGKLALLAFVILLPTLTVGAILAAARGYRRLSKLRQSRLRQSRHRQSRHRQSRLRQSRPLPAEPVDRVAARLRRLRAELEEIENQPGGTAKRHHILALRGAYLDTLSSACQRFGVRPPAGGDRARQSEIYRVEAALREHGLDVREAAVR